MVLQAVVHGRHVGLRVLLRQAPQSDVGGVVHVLLLAGQVLVVVRVVAALREGVHDDGLDVLLLPREDVEGAKDPAQLRAQRLPLVVQPLLVGHARGNGLDVLGREAGQPNLGHNLVYVVLVQHDLAAALKGHINRHGLGGHFGKLCAA